MRERLLAAFAALTLLTVMLYGVPRAFVRADRVADEAQSEVDQAARAVAEVVAARMAADLSPAGATLEFLPDTDRAVYRDGDREQLLAGLPSTPDAVVGTAAVAGGGVVEVQRAQDEVDEEVVRAVVPIVLTGLVALVAAVLAAALLSARLSRPFRVLAAHASELGDGRFDGQVAPQKVREAEAIAVALRASAARIAAMLQREREFARNASHQLRTPLTGLRLRIEDTAQWPETPPSVRDELGQVLAEVDRLSDTVTSLLAFARDEDAPSWDVVPPAEVLAAAGERWQPVAGVRARAIEVRTGASGAIPLPRVAVDQILDVLIDNALKHGAGTVTLACDLDTAAVRFLVHDEGAAPEVADAELFRRGSSGSDGEGIGLALCRDLAQAVGGRLVLAARRPTTFELVLPADRR